MLFRSHLMTVTAAGGYTKKSWKTCNIKEKILEKEKTCLLYTSLMDLILGHKIDVVIDTPPQGVEHQKDGFVIRRNAIETGVNVLTSLDTCLLYTSLMLMWILRKR